MNQPRPDGPRAYLDHAATTPMVDAARERLTALLGLTGNPSSLHGSGRAARRVVEESREEIAALLGARPTEVVLCSGGTEADNLALKGLFWSRRAADPRRRRVLTSAVEHHAVLDPLAWLAAHDDAVVEVVPTGATGRLDVDALRSAVARDPHDVALITCMGANNEVGTVQPVSEVVEVAAEHGVPVHTDAVQVAGHLGLDLAASGVATAAVSAHKLGGPVGVGALLARRGTDLVPLVHGGGQEQDLRSGTPAAALVAAFATALRVAGEARDAQAERLETLRTRLLDGMRAAVPDVVVNGDDRPGHRLPSIAHLSFPGCEGDSLLMLLDAAGVECSTGSACTAGVTQASHVLLAMGRDEPAARGSLRVSLGHTSTAADVDALVVALPAVVERARAAGLVGSRAR